MTEMTLRLITLVLLLTTAGCDAGKRPDRIALTLGKKEFNLEVATTDAEISRGLMYREELADDGGMIFVFTDQRVRNFWMKNCKIDLDILYFDASGRIVNIQTMRYPRTPEENRDPPSYSSRWPARFAIELNAGEADKLGLKEGDKPDMPVDRIKRLAE